MNNFPDIYKLDQNLGWEDFEVNGSFDNSYIRMNFNGIEYMSDIFITYLPGGSNLTVDTERKRRVVLKVNRNGHNAYPDIVPGDGYLFTIYNEDLGTVQLGTKPVRLVAANENCLVFRGYDIMAMGPFGLIDPGNTDYGVAVFLENKGIRKIACYRYDTKKCYEYANTINRPERLALKFTAESETPTQNNCFSEPTDINYDIVKRNADSFLKRFSTMSLQEKMHLASESDRIFNIGAGYWNEGNQTSALRYFSDALRLFPINTDVIGIYGDYYEYSDYDRSMKFYELAIELNSIRKKDYYQLANFYKWKGECDKANRCYALWELVKIRFGIEDD